MSAQAVVVLVVGTVIVLFMPALILSTDIVAWYEGVRSRMRRRWVNR